MIEKDLIPSRIEKLQKNNKILLGIIAVLSILVIILFFSRQNVVGDKEESVSQAIELKSEFDLLMEEYESIKKENIDLSVQLTERDSIIMVNAKEINDLIATQADYRKIKKKLALLRNITQDYVKRIDSLVVVNKELNEENTQIKTEIQIERKKNTELSQTKQVLEEKVSVASALKAYNIAAITYRLRGDNKEVQTDKAKRVDRINIRFTLSENKLIPAGEKTLYVRIARPDGVVLSEGDGDEFSFITKEDKQLQYSIKKTINYTNSAQEVLVRWDKKDASMAAMEGVYTFSLYMDGVEIGRSTFSIGK